MFHDSSISRRIFAALAGVFIAIVPADAAQTITQTAQPVRVAQADCYAVGQRVASQNGGTLAKATLSSQGGQPVCVIVVLVPGKDGQRPRRAEFVVPAN